MWIAEIVVATVAVYGAVLSTINYFSNRTRIKVKVYTGFPTWGENIGETALFLEANNPGKRSITISGIGFKVIGHNFNAALINPRSNVKFPYELEPGKNCIVWCTAEDVISPLVNRGLRSTVKVRVYFSTQVGKEYKSKKREINLEKWARGEMSI